MAVGVGRKSGVRNENVVNLPSMDLSRTLPHLHLKARFLEISGELENIPAITNHWEGQTLVGIQSAAQARAFLRQLESRPGTTNLAEPEATTASRRHAEMRATHLETITRGVMENQYEHDPQTGAHGSSTTTSWVGTNVETGPVLDITPIVEEDGKTIDLKVNASLRRFDGYSVRDNPETIYNDILIKTTTDIRPVINQRQLGAHLKIYDGQTLLMYEGPPVVVAPSLDPLTGQAFSPSRVIGKHLLVLVTAAIVDGTGHRVHSDGEIPFAGDHVPPKQEYQGAPLSDWPFDISPGHSF